MIRASDPPHVKTNVARSSTSPVAACSARATRDLAPALVQRLRAIALEARSTMFAVMLAGFFAHLHRVTGQRDVAIASLLGPSIGYLQAQSELYGWNLNDRIRATYQKDFAQIGMTDAQQSAAWQQAQARETKLTSLPPKA